MSLKFLEVNVGKEIVKETDVVAMLVPLVLESQMIFGLSTMCLKQIRKKICRYVQ